MYFFGAEDFRTCLYGVAFSTDVQLTKPFQFPARWLVAQRHTVSEFMLCSTLVLSSNAGCAKEIIDKFGFVMNDNNEKSIYKYIVKVIKTFKYNKNKWKHMEKNAQLKIKKNYSIEQMSDMYLNNWTL